MVAEDVKWKDEPSEHHYDGAEEFLTLMFSSMEVNSLVGMLRSAPMSEFAAKDIFRAAGLTPLPEHNFHVRRNTEKLNRGEKLSPVLLVKVRALHRLVVADGMHRLCSVYLWNEDIRVPSKLATL